jgi:hypothetical protein
MLGAPETALKERLGHAIVDLIASRAGCQTTQPHTDYKSTDINISPMADDLPMQIDVQIKGVTTLKIDGAFLKYRLEKRNYDHLRRTDLLVPRMLVVADINKLRSKWVRCKNDSVVFSNSVYWLDLHDLPDATQKTKVPVRIPIANRLDPDELVALLKRGYANSKSGKGGLS